MYKKRAVMIISGANDYELYCLLYKLEPVTTCLDILTRNYYTKILQQSGCLHCQNSFLPYAFGND